MLIVGLTDAVATGLFTLGGVFLGALAGAGLEYLRGRRADRKEARRATRLVLLELGVLTKLTDLYFERAEQAARAETPKDREYWERLEARVSEDLDHYGPIPPAWNEHRGTLAEILPDHAWKKIESATRMLEINRGLPPPDPNWVGDFDRWEDMHSKLNDATQVLAAYSGSLPRTRMALARRRRHRRRR